MLSAFSFQEFRSINRKLVVGRWWVERWLVTHTHTHTHTDNSLRLRKTWNNEEYSATGGIYAPLSKRRNADEFRAARKTFRPAAGCSIAYTRVDRYRDVVFCVATSFPRLFDLWSVHWPSESPTLLYRETHVISNRNSRRSRDWSAEILFKNFTRR